MVNFLWTQTLDARIMPRKARAARIVRTLWVWRKHRFFILLHKICCFKYLTNSTIVLSGYSHRYFFNVKLRPLDKASKLFDGRRAASALSLSWYRRTPSKKWGVVTPDLVAQPQTSEAKLGHFRRCNLHRAFRPLSPNIIYLKLWNLCYLWKVT